MRLIYATDLHGDATAYVALAQLADQERADAVLLGGDLFPNRREAAPQLAVAETVLRPFLARLRARGIPVLAIYGNDDRAPAVARLRDFADAGLLTLLGSAPHRLVSRREPDTGADIVGYPLVPPTPFRNKEHERRDLATDRYGGPWPILVSSPASDGDPLPAPDNFLDRLPSIEEDLAAIPATGTPCILIAHSPPWGVLDRAHTVEHAGSRAIRAWIAAQQPLLALHGHIHEAPDLLGRWAQRLGATICVNPGPALETAVQAVVFDTDALPRSLRHTTRAGGALA